eukprot:875560-Rhodomonas_salina.1
MAGKVYHLTVTSIQVTNLNGHGHAGRGFQAAGLDGRVVDLRTRFHGWDTLALNSVPQCAPSPSRAAEYKIQETTSLPTGWPRRCGQAARFAGPLPSITGPSVASAATLIRVQRAQAVSAFGIQFSARAHTSVETR